MMSAAESEDPTTIIQAYADRGVFRGGLVATEKGDSVTNYRIRWHRSRNFSINLDRSKKRLRIGSVLPSVPAKSSMFSEYKAFIESFQNGDRPEHRSNDNQKVSVRCEARGGDVGLAMEVKDEDYAYALQRLLDLIHETYVMFVMGPYDDYRVQKLGADPDWSH